MRRERRVRIIIVSVLTALPLMATSIDSAIADGARTGSNSATGRASVGAVSSGDDRFEDPLDTDAPYFPLEPGTQFVYDGTVTDAEGAHRHRVIFTVTDLVKKIDGVNTRVIWDQDINDGELTEAELAFFAQDRRDNVWTMGEYPEEYEGGAFVGAPSTWISGVAGPGPES
jgi:hypothetical protein